MNFGTVFHDYKYDFYVEPRVITRIAFFLYKVAGIPSIQVFHGEILWYQRSKSQSSYWLWHGYYKQWETMMILGDVL